MQHTRPAMRAAEGAAPGAARRALYSHTTPGDRASVPLQLQNRYGLTPPQHNINSVKIHQSDREKIIAEFRENKINVLLASDVASRGIDIPNVELVVNYDIPNNCEEYIHRVGRTGRAGKSGKALLKARKREDPDRWVGPAVVLSMEARAWFGCLTAVL